MGKATLDLRSLEIHFQGYWWQPKHGYSEVSLTVTPMDKYEFQWDYSPSDSGFTPKLSLFGIAPYYLSSKPVDWGLLI